jgi:hypothetical protein
MTMTREQRIANLVKARATKKAKYEAGITAANVPVTPVEPIKEVGVTVPPPTEPSTVTTVAPSHTESEEIILESLDHRQLEVCISDICWKGKEITITNDEWQRMVKKGNPTFRYEEMVAEVSRILREGGFLFHKKGALL